MCNSVISIKQMLLFYNVIISSLIFSAIFRRQIQFKQFRKWVNFILVRVDLTKPIAGTAVDGTVKNLTDLAFSSSKSTVQVQWDYFYDRESGIREYDILVARKG
jgi:hypothetical protein